MQIDENLIRLIGLLAALLIALIGMGIIYWRMKDKKQGFGAVTTKALAIVIFVPVVLAVSATTNLAPEAIAALLGTVAGYLFSGSGPEKPEP